MIGLLLFGASFALLAYLLRRRWVEMSHRNFAFVERSEEVTREEVTLEQVTVYSNFEDFMAAQKYTDKPPAYDEVVQIRD